MKFEYKVIKTKDSISFADTMMDELGQNGWELVNVVADGQVTNWKTFYFKRELK